MRGMQMKRAFFIIGPESSGTRMLAQVLIAAGCAGDGSHKQAMDDWDFAQYQRDIIVYRQSIPHAGNMPEIALIIASMQAQGFEVTPIVILRDHDFNCQSQVRRGHTATIELADERINEAHTHIFKELTKMVKLYVTVIYGDFVTVEAVRRSFFEYVNLPYPEEFEFYDGNAKYRRYLA